MIRTTARHPVLGPARAACLAIVLFLASAGLAMAAPLVLALARATVGPDAATGRAVLNLVLTADGASAFGTFSTAEAGHQIDVRIDGEVVMSPRLMEPILGGVIQVSGDFTFGELIALARRLNGGAALTVEAAPEQ